LFLVMFGDVSIIGDEAWKLVGEHPVLSMVSDFIEKVK